MRGRVLSVYEPSVGGVPLVARRDVESLLGAGFAVTVCAPQEPHDLDGHPAFRYVELPVTRARTGSHPAAVRRLRHLVESGDYDVVHLYSSVAGALGRLATATRRRHSTAPAILYAPHGGAWCVPGWRGRAYGAVESALGHWADLVIACSREEAEQYARLAPRTRVTVMENGVDTDHFVPPVRRRAPSDPVRIGCVGRLCRQKGQDLLLEALDGLEDHPWTLEFVGDGPLRSHLRQRIESAAWLRSGRVSMAGHQPSGPDLFGSFDLLVMPSRWEGMSLAMLESMAMGLPVVTYQVNGASALGADYPLVAEDRTVAALRERLRLALDMPADHLHTLGARLRERAVRHHSLRAVQSRYVGLVARACDGAFDARRPSVRRATIRS